MPDIALPTWPVQPAMRSGGGLLKSMRRLLVAGIAVLLVACASSGPRGSDSGKARSGPAPTWQTDGPGLSPPADLDSVPDAQPAVEAMRSGAMRPYAVLGRSYVPITEDLPFSERGLASWYGRKFQGRPTASGEPYDMYAMTAAHTTLPLPSYVRVRNPANGREVIVRVNDRGPFHPGRIIDLSYTAAFKLDLLRAVAPVEIERITNQQIVSGSWRRTATQVAGSRVEPTAAPQPTPRPSPQPSMAEVAVQVPAGAVVPVVATTLPVRSAEESQPTQLEQTPVDSTSSGYWVQLGAFRVLDGAQSFHRRISTELAWIAPALSVRSEAELHRLQAGPYADRDEAAAVATRLRESLRLVPVIVEGR